MLTVFVVNRGLKMPTSRVVWWTGLHKTDCSAEVRKFVATQGVDVPANSHIGRDVGGISLR